MLGANVRSFERRFEDGWRLDPDRIARALTPRTRVVVLTNPHNPSGVLAGEDDLFALAEVAGKSGATVLVDEVYLDLPGGRPAATLSPAFVSTNSLTKAYGLASLRCGWALASPELTERIRRSRDVVDVWSPIPSDRLSVVAFQEIDRLAERARRLFLANSPLVASFLLGRPELECVPSRATIAFPRFRDGRDASPFVEKLFREQGVAVVPGAFFDSPSHFRIAFGGGSGALASGLAAIGACLDG
jgi:aspartate/methionine/tyrosine aminotransferase